MERKVRIVVALTVLALGLFWLSGWALSSPRDEVRVYAAPTLVKLAEDAAKAMRERVTVEVMGSLAAVRRVQLGSRPDVLLSVDSEVVGLLRSYRSVSKLGRFELVLVCREPTELADVGRRRIALGDPNTAPIGYRAVAALYWLSTRAGLFDLRELEVELSVRFVAGPDGRSVEMDLRDVSGSPRFPVREDLAAAFAVLENGAADCAFAYTPFVVSRGLAGRYFVLRMPEEISFRDDPPIGFRAVTALGEIEVRRFEAVAIAFTERGERYVEALQALLSQDPSRYGLVR